MDSGRRIRSVKRMDVEKNIEIDLGSLYLKKVEKEFGLVGAVAFNLLIRT